MCLVWIGGSTGQLSQSFLDSDLPHTLYFHRLTIISYLFPTFLTDLRIQNTSWFCNSKHSERIYCIRSFHNPRHSKIKLSKTLNIFMNDLFTKFIINVVAEQLNFV